MKERNMERIISLVLNYIFIFTNETPSTLASAIGVSDHLVREWCRYKIDESAYNGKSNPNKANTIHIMLYISKHYNEPDIIKVLSYLNPNVKINENDLNVLKKCNDFSKLISTKRYSSGIKKTLIDTCSPLRIDCNSEDNPSIYEVINDMIV